MPLYFGLLDSGRPLDRDYWLSLAPGCRRVEIEIGPGDCGFLIEQARRDPGTIYVGLEVRGHVVRRVRGRKDLPVNFALFEMDGRWLVESMLAPASVDAFHVYFPDPWWKKRHQKRRLLRSQFCDAALSSLRPQAALYLMSDVAFLFDEGAQALEAAGFVRQQWTRDAENSAQSSYERKYRRQGRRFSEGRFQRRR